MDNKVKLKFVGGVEDSIVLRCPDIFNIKLNKGDVFDVSCETYEKDFKNNFKFVLVGEKPTVKSGTKNKMEKETLPEEEIN